MEVRGRKMTTAPSLPPLSTPSTSLSIAFLAASGAAFFSAKHPTIALVAARSFAAPTLGLKPSPEKVLTRGPCLVTVYTGTGRRAFTNNDFEDGVDAPLALEDHCVEAVVGEGLVLNAVAELVVNLGEVFDLVEPRGAVGGDTHFAKRHKECWPKKLKKTLCDFRR